MVEVLIYFSLFSFWLDVCADFQLEKLFGLTMGLSLQNIILYLLLIVWGLTLKSRGNLFHQNNVNRYIFILIIFVAISIPLNVLIGYGGQEASLKQEIVNFKRLLNPWLYFFLITTMVSDKRTCKRFISALVLFLLATVFAVLIQSFLQINAAVQLYRTYEGRSAGFAEASQYAAFLVLFIPLFLSSFLFQKDQPKKFKGFIFLFIGLIGLISTISKAGYFSFFVSIGCFFFYANKKRMIGVRKIIVYMVSIFTILTVVYFILPSTVKEKVSERVTLATPEEELYNPWAIERSFLTRLTSGRTKIWMNSLEFIAQKPFLGYGKTIASSYITRGTHNEYLGWLLNYGVIGFFLFSMIYIKIFRHVKYHFKTSTNPKDRILYLSYMCGFIGYVTAMLATNMAPPRIIFWIYTAIIYKYTQLDATS